MPTYEDRGVSPHKPDVKRAVSKLNTNVYPGAFCWMTNDVLTGSENNVVVTHADGAGTKSSLAYIYYKETGDSSVFRDIAHDSLAMNIDDMVTVGCTGPFVLSNTIGRNAKLIDAEIVSQIIQGYQEQCEMLAEHGIIVEIGGGETADLGDVVRTVVVDTTLTTIIPRELVVDCSRVEPGMAIVGLASYGKAKFEPRYNSGIGTNGFTALRHDLLSSYYAEKYPESFAPEICNIAYRGRFKLEEHISELGTSLAEAILAPTRIYSPVIKSILESCRPAIRGIFHNSGGGQTKCLSFGNYVHYVKDNPILPSPIFGLIRTEAKASLREMVRTYNMGSRIELVCEPGAVSEVISIAGSFGIDAERIGEVLASAKPAEMTYVLNDESVHFDRDDTNAGH